MLTSITAVVTWTSYAFYLLLYTNYSSVSLTAGNASPRYASTYYNVYLIWFLMGALILFADRIVRLDGEERIAETLHSRPVSNVVLLGGKLTALLLVAWLPLVFVISTIQAFGALGSTFGWPNLAFSSVSWMGVLFVDALPAFVFWTSLVVALAVSYRSRFAFHATAFVLLSFIVVTDNVVPNYLLPAVSLASTYDGWSSDLAPRLPDARVLVHRFALLAFGAGFLALAAATYARRDDTGRAVRVPMAVVPIALATALIGAVINSCFEDAAVRDRWRQAHGRAAMQADGDKGYQVADVVSVTGDVRIDPGEVLAIDLLVRLRHQADGEPRLLFSLNPGIVVASIAGDDGEPLSFSQRAGLLYVETPREMATDNDFSFRLRASGRPDMRFGHLDDPVTWQRLRRGNRLKQLGTSIGIFHDDYVALTPETAWLPIAGPSAATTVNGTDSFQVSLRVSAPDGWTVASPGARTISATATRVAPRVPVTRLGLFAADFRKETTEIADVMVNLLLHPDHAHNLDFVNEAGIRRELESRAATVLSGLAEDGLPFPFEALHIVEVPSYFRIYRGGLDLRAANSLPGILLVREQGIPNARLAWHHRPQQTGTADPLRLAQAAAANIASLLNAPASPENMTQGLARLVSVGQAPARGVGAPVLNVIVEELAALVANPSRAATEPIFSAHTYNRKIQFGATIFGMFHGLLGLRSSEVTFYSPWMSRPAVYELAEETAATDIHLSLAHSPHAPGTHPQDARHLSLDTLDAELLSGVVELKGKATARYLHDVLGRGGAATILATLRRQFGDAGFELSDFLGTLAEQDRALAAAIGLWLEQDALPGFRVSPVEVFAVRGTDTPNAPQYAARVHVRNTEAPIGFLQPSTSPFEPDRHFGAVAVPGHASVEITLYFAQLPDDIWILPYLSLNRFPIRLTLPSGTDHPTRRIDPADGQVRQTSRPSDWMPPPVEHVVIDDLDPGFRVARQWNWHRRLLARSYERRELDNGLPIQPQRIGVWGRRDMPTAWGEHRRTAVGALPGDDEASAMFQARLPSAGRWQLDLFLPDRRVDMRVGQYTYWRFFRALGTYQIDVVSAGQSTRITFDAGRAAAGWNELERFDFGSGDVSVIVSNRTDGDVVIVDAIRWRQV